VERGHDCPLSLGANAGRVFEKAARASDPDARRLVAEHAVFDLIRIISAGQAVSPQAPRARVTVPVSP